MSDFSQITVDQVRSYWDQRPCNIRHSPKPVGTREYFDEVEARKYFVEPHIPRFADFARWRGKKVLEIGCGIGTDTVNFARHGAMVTAVDLSPQSIELARTRVEVYGLQDQVRFYSGSAEELTATVPIAAHVGPHKAQIRLMNESRCLERLPRLFLHQSPGHQFA